MTPDLRERWKRIQTHIGARPDGDPDGPNTVACLEVALGLEKAHVGYEPRRISEDGLKLVKHFEGLYLTAYQDSVNIWTIGWGHTGLTHQDGTVHAGRAITREKAEELLRHDMRAFEKRVSSLVKVSLNDDQFSALVSFDFNTGGLGKSTLLKLLNAGQYKEAAEQFLRWNKAGGRVLKGLTRRRRSERNLFLSVRPFIVE